MRHPIDPTKKRKLTKKDITKIEPLLVDIMEDGKVVYELPSLENIRSRRDDDLSLTDSGVKRLVNPHVHHVSLSQAVWEKKEKLIEQMKG